MDEQNEVIIVKKAKINELKDTLDLVNNIIERQNQGQEVTIEDGKVSVKMEEGIIIPLGTLPDLSETTTAIFGDSKVPKEVEYIKLEGITFMT